FSRPVLLFQKGGGQIELDFQWPAVYVGRFNFGVRHTSDLGQPFTDLPVSAPVQISGDQFKITFTAPVAAQHYYYLTISLR
ncbi:MAG: hypothetical protein KGJ60_12045, partial [Verrucomicrobiota bacterium]|nr:hypothetical protein [Verrucomicrobiota bacterium]